MKVQAFKTPLVKANDDLFKILEESLTNVPERSILVIASKIVSTCENRFVPKVKGDHEEKHALVRQEAELYTEPHSSKYDLMLTVKRNWIFVNSGIDESNADDQYILWPEDPQRAVNEIWNFLRYRYNLKEVGVTMSDSGSIPLNWGVTGHSIAHCGFNPLKSYIGQPDLFGRLMKMEQVSVAQSVTAAATFVMGEGNEGTPLGLVTDLPEGIEFVDHVPTEAELASLKIELEDDVFAPLLINAEWHPALNPYESVLKKPLEPKETKKNADILFEVAEGKGLSPKKETEYGLVSVEVKGQRRFIFPSFSSFNSQEAAQFVKNKHITRLILEKNGVENIPFCLPQNWDEIEAFFHQHGSVIAKPVTGTRSYAVFLIETLEELKKVPFQKYFFEKYIEGSEYRFVILDNQVIEVHQRDLTPTDENRWAKKTTPVDVETVDQAQRQRALEIAKIFNLGFGAVDFIKDEHGQYWLLEVNSSPGLNPSIAIAFLDKVLESECSTI